ncbi:hypothetical protein VNI00_005467 [Paramarasmius palmivorus]|uniref:Uncharacterized protein n=1 Tax=Paramarasmius palmivorus TaxID=297713 RepID=A0AAW0DFD7_9AGAR
MNQIKVHDQYLEKDFLVHRHQPGGHAIAFAIVAQGLLSKIIDLFDRLSVPYKDLARDILQRQPQISRQLPDDSEECIALERHYQDVLRMIVPELPYLHEGLDYWRQHQGVLINPLVREFIFKIDDILKLVPQYGRFASKEQWNQLRQSSIVLLLELQFEELSCQEPFLSDSRHDGARMEECSRSFCDPRGLTQFPTVYLFDTLDDDMAVDELDAPVDGTDSKFLVWSLAQPTFVLEDEHPFRDTSVQEEYDEITGWIKQSHSEVVGDDSFAFFGPLGGPPPTLEEVRAIMRSSEGKPQTKVEEAIIRRFLASQINRELRLELKREQVEECDGPGSLTQAVNVLRRSLVPAEAKDAGDTQLDMLAATARWEAFIRGYLNNPVVDPAHLI